ncbi:MAG: tol-pal system-associated acyl-CoA thioesterase [Bauldia sp.]|jgi:acyl-CoA thioester hydrolase|nr:tol-pal system-associated acyl-CoA thioesterase [Bauldia sp.]
MTTREDWPDLAGRLTGDRHVLPVRVYFEDTDFSGVVYHGSYIRFMERGRSDFVRLIGIGHADLDAGVHGEPLAFAVRRIDIEYRKPARIDDLLEVETRVEEIRGASIRLRQTVRRGADVLTGADVTVVFINREGRARRIPDLVRERLAGGAAT